MGSHEPENLPATIADVLFTNARTLPHVEAVTDGLDRVSWQELCARAESACAQFRNLGIRKGDRVAVILPNQIDTVVLYWACAMWGCIFVGANSRLGSDDLRATLMHCKPVIAFVPDAERASYVPREIRCIIVSDQSDADSFFAVDATLAAEEFAPVQSSDTFAIVYTSGTTGPAKGVMLTHHNLLWTAQSTVLALAVTQHDTFLTSVQITHIFGLSATLLVAALRGARSVLMREHAAGSALDLCEWEGVTVHHGSPTTWVLELAAQRRAPRDLSTLRTGIIAAAPVPPDLVDAIRDELGCNIEIAWGLSETSPTVTITQPSDPPDARRASVGRPLPGIEIRCVDVGGQYGEIEVRSPGVFAGYFNDPVRTAAVLSRDGFLRTGDLGWIDDAGYLHLAGRAKDIIIRGALHVYPEELEALIRELPWVAAVAVVGVPDRVLGERTCACVVVSNETAGPSDLLGSIRAVIGDRLADYKLPDVVVRVSELPHSVGGKVLKRVLREDAIARIAVQ